VLHRSETFGRKHLPVAHAVVKIISHFKAQTLSDRVRSPGKSVRVGSGRVGSGRVIGSDPVPSLVGDVADSRECYHAKFGRAI